MGKYLVPLTRMNGKEPNSFQEKVKRKVGFSLLENKSRTFIVQP
jgi:hypothetical protein